MEYDTKFMGRMLKYAREAKKLTQYEASELLNLSESYYKSLEGGVSTPSLPNFISIIQFFNISADSLLFPKVSDTNSTYHQITRLLGRCNDAELLLVLSLVAAVLSNNNAVAPGKKTPNLEELYAKALSERECNNND